MTLEALKTILDTTGLDVSYSSVPLEKAERPYICYAQDSNANFPADGVVFFSRRVVAVRLYTDTRDEITEAKVETALNGMYWSKAIEYLEDQKIYEITYTIEV